jgi:hypothetical protein
MRQNNFLLGAAVSALVLYGAGGTSSVSTMLSPAAAQAQTTRVETTTTQEASVDGFYDQLRPYGELVQVDSLGGVWKPTDVAADWQPYSNGRWIYNQEVGWYFESDEPWAEITYHYGRWYDDPDQGWVWVAGTEWAPAWVEWRRNDRYVGWRPLPPDNAPQRTARRTSTTTVTRTAVPEEAQTWVFVPADQIVDESVQRVRIHDDQLVQIYPDTEIVGSVERRNGYAVNLALEPQIIERGARVRITSQNLPRPDLAPVPGPVRQIATETRSTTRINRDTRQTDVVQPGSRSDQTTTGSIGQDTTRQGVNRLHRDQATTTDRTVTGGERTREGIATEGGMRGTNEADSVRMRENGRIRTEATDRAEREGRSTTERRQTIDQNERRITGERDGTGTTDARQAEERRSTTTDRQRANRQGRDQDVTGSTSPARPDNNRTLDKGSDHTNRMGAEPRGTDPANRNAGGMPHADRQDTSGHKDVTGSTSPADRQSPSDRMPGNDRRSDSGGRVIGQQQQPVEPANRNGGAPRNERRGGAPNDDTTGSITPSNRQPGGPQAIPEKIQPGPSNLGQPTPGQNGR